MSNEEKQKYIILFWSTFPCAIRFLIIYVISVVVILLYLSSTTENDAGALSWLPFIPMFIYGSIIGSIFGDSVVTNSWLVYIFAYIFTGVFLALATQFICMLVKLIQSIGNE